VTVQAEILDLLRQLRDETGTAIVLITHNMGVVADLADRVAVMFRGDLVEVSSVERLFSDPKEEYTRELLAAVPRLGSTVAGSRKSAAAEAGRGSGASAADSGASAADSGASGAASAGEPSAGATEAGQSAAEAGQGQVRESIVTARDLDIVYPG